MNYANPSPRPKLSTLPSQLSTQKPLFIQPGIERLNQTNLSAFRNFPLSPSPVKLPNQIHAKSRVFLLTKIQKCGTMVLYVQIMTEG